MLPETFNYTTLDDCVTLVLELTGLTAEPADLRGLLEVSAGSAVGVEGPVFRPYFVAAAIKDGELNQKRVRELRGIKFDFPSETVAGLLRRQLSLDKALALTVLDGMSAVFAAAEVMIVTNRRRGW